MLNIDFLEFENSRYERKIVLRDVDTPEIQALIKLHPAMFSEIFYKRQINNIYFDTLDMKNYSEHVNGVAQRLKVRIRWYGELFGKIQHPVLEIKIKHNDLMRKISFKLKEFNFDEGFSLKNLHESLDRAHLPEEILKRLKEMQPCLLNTYIRKYFLSSDKKYRLTLDTDLQFFRIDPTNNFFINRACDEEAKIIELKFSRKDEETISFITDHLPFRISRYSKYVAGIEMLNI